MDDIELTNMSTKNKLFFNRHFFYPQPNYFTTERSFYLMPSGPTRGETPQGLYAVVSGGSDVNIGEFGYILHGFPTSSSVPP
jgi:hypothetical protein